MTKPNFFEREMLDLSTDYVYNYTDGSLDEIKAWIKGHDERLIERIDKDLKVFRKKHAGLAVVSAWWREELAQLKQELKNTA